MLYKSQNQFLFNLFSHFFNDSEWRFELESRKVEKKSFIISKKGWYMRRLSKYHTSKQLVLGGSINCTIIRLFIRLFILIWREHSHCRYTWFENTKRLCELDTVGSIYISEFYWIIDRSFGYPLFRFERVFSSVFFGRHSSPGYRFSMSLVLGRLQLMPVTVIMLFVVLSVLSFCLALCWFLLQFFSFFSTLKWMKYASNEAYRT